MTFISSFPDKLALLEFFESEPSYAQFHDLHFAYEYTDHYGVKLIFSFNAVEGWLQIVIESNGREISRYLFEGVTKFDLKDDKYYAYIHSQIDLDNTITEIKVYIKPNISVNCSTLLT